MTDLVESGSGLPGDLSAAALVDATPVAMLLLDATGRIVHFNPEAERLTGWPAREVVAKHFVACGLLNPASHASAAATFLRLLAGERISGVELELARPDRTGLAVALAGGLARTGDSPRVVAVSLTDLSQRRQTEEKLRLAQKTEGVGRLATGLAHDFNNVLTVIKGYSEVLLLNPRLPPEAVKQIRSMAASAERGASVTRQLLTFSRRQVLEFKSLEINEVLSNVTQMLRRLVSENISLQFKYASGLPAVHADLGMLEQTISNFVLHAREAMPAGGQLTLETGLVEVDEATASQHFEAKPGKFVTVSITDTGAGMALAAAQDLLQRLGSAVELIRGPALGLSIALSIVRQHQGWVAVQSAVGQGTCFRIHLPASELPPERTGAVAPPERIPGGQEVILVVEDEPSIRELAKSILAGYGYTVLEAGSGPEALAVWEKQQGRIDLLFTDMVMPGGLTGRMLAETLEGRSPGLRVLYTTGYSLDLVQSNIALRPGFNLLPKPYNTSSLALAIRRCLDRPRQP